MLYFFRSSTSAHVAAVIAAVRQRRDLFDVSHDAFFDVTTDHEDEAQNRLTAIVPGYRFFCSYDNKIARAYGSAPLDGSEAKCYCKWVIINPMTQVTAVILLREDRGDIAEALDHVVRVSPAGRLASMDIHAAAIVLENVFGHKTCRSADETTFSPTKPNAGPSPRTSVAASCRR